MREGEPLTDRRLVGRALVVGYPGDVAVPVRIQDAQALTGTTAAVQCALG